MKISQGVAMSIGVVWLLAITTITGYEIERVGHHLHSQHSLIQSR